MTEVTFVVPDLAAATQEFPLLEPGDHILGVASVELAVIKGGRYEGKPALNVAFEKPGYKWVWKILPMFQPDEDDSKGLAWVAMSSARFFKQAGLTPGEKFTPELLKTMKFRAVVGLQPRADVPTENQAYIISF